jgi:hypothetical protein
VKIFFLPIEITIYTKKSLIQTDLVTDCNGNLWIQTNRTKTAIRANVPVLKITPSVFFVAKASFVL